jgi:hypothetical protein
MTEQREVASQIRPLMTPIRVGIVFVAFPAKDLAPYKYFLLLLNRLQSSCGFELFDVDEDDEFVQVLNKTVVNKTAADGDIVRNGLDAFGIRVRKQIATSVDDFDLSEEQPDQIVVITGVTLSDSHFLIRRKRTTMLCLGEWERHMAPPSLAEFLQLVVLRATYSALEGNAWNTIHLGTRGCIFDFTENLGNTRFMVLTGVGVCSACAAALERDGFSNAANEIRRVASCDWRGDRQIAGTPTNIMERLGYPLYLTKSFEPSLGERLRLLFTDEGSKELIKFVFAILIAWLVFRLGWK